MTTISVVIPVYSGENYLEQLIARLAHVRDNWARTYAGIELVEVILVDDAAVDSSPHIIARLQEENEWIQSIKLSRNFGQHPATIAGILHAAGDWIVTLDEDLQHRPEHIEDMLRRAVTEQADVVYMSSEGAVHNSWRRDVPSRVSKWAIAWVARNPVIKKFSSFRLCRGSVARASASVAGHETYFDVALTWFTDRFTFESAKMVDQRFQHSGRSGYNFGRLVSHARRLVVSSHTRLIRLAAYLGLTAVLLAGFFGTRALVRQVAGTPEISVPGWPSLFVSILFFGGLTAFLLVVILEYLTNVTLHTQGKPTFFVVDRSGDKAVADELERNDGAVPTE